jgi:hypothetical protein
MYIPQVGVDAGHLQVHEDVSRICLPAHFCVTHSRLQLVGFHFLPSGIGLGGELEHPQSQVDCRNF